MDFGNNSSYNLDGLPNWIKPLIPEKSFTRYFSYDASKKKYLVRLSDTNEVISYDSMHEAYYNKYDSKYLYSEFDETLPEYKNGPIKDCSDIFMLFGKRENGSVPAYISTSENFYIDSIREDLELWKNGNFSQYEKNKEDFGASYLFLRDHPAFWITSREGSLKYLSWDTNSGIIASRIEAYADEDSLPQLKMKFYSEPGARVLPDGWHHYGDSRLIAYGDSYEEVVIKTAAKVYEHFDSEGNDLGKDG